MAENSDGEFEKTSKEEKDQLAHGIVMRQFLQKSFPLLLVVEKKIKK